MRLNRSDPSASIPTRPVRNPAVSELSFGTKSLDAAILQLERNPRRVQAESDFEPHRDAIITHIEYSQCSVVLGLSDQFQLVVALAGGTIRWRFEPVAASRTLLLGDPPSAVYLKYARHSDRWLWERERLLQSRIGTRVYRLFAGMVNIKLYLLDISPSLRA